MTAATDAAERLALVKRLGDGHHAKGASDGHSTTVIGCPWCVADTGEELVQEIIGQMNPDVDHELVAYTARFLLAAISLPPS